MAIPTHEPEILVVGAGPGGSAAAWALAQAGHDVLLVDRAEFPRDKTCGDGLPPFAVQTLRQMGVLSQVEAAAPARIERVSMTSPFGMTAVVAFADFLPAEMSYSLVVPRLVLDDILRQHAISAGAQYAGSVRVERIERTGDRVSSIHAVTPDGPATFRPQQVVMAVGASMGLLERAGFITRRPQVVRAARVYYTGVNIPSDMYCFHYDLDMIPGYGWMFPTGDGRANVGAGTFQTPWSTRRSAQSLLDGYVRRRSREGLFRHAQQAGPVKGYPLRIDFPGERAAGENWILIGESAGLVNPLTGEGIDLAMESGLMGASILHENIKTGRRDHRAYQRELFHRFAPIFNGLKALRDILVAPFMMDYVVWQTRQHRYLSGKVVRINLGVEPPQTIFHPLFILQFFTPLSPWFLLQQGISHLGGYAPGKARS